MKPRIWPIVLWAGLGIAVLMALGTWQLFRLAEKQALLAEIARRTKAPPISIERSSARGDKGADIEFVRVKTQGVFDHAVERHKLASFEGSPAGRSSRRSRATRALWPWLIAALFPMICVTPANGPENARR